MKILLTTLHAKYSHASLALPCLASYCRDIPEADIVINEWTVNEPREHTLRLIMAEDADLIGFSCYIWNIEMTLKLVSDIKKIAPQTKIVLGGPEVSFGIFELMQNNLEVDFVVKGEGEVVFRKLLEALVKKDSVTVMQACLDIEGLFFRDGDDIVSGTNERTNLSLDSLESPFNAGLVDFSKPLIYYETSRGCPFSCAFCLSSTEGSVRSFGMDRIKTDLLYLINRRISQIKLVDRTFNYNAKRADEIWSFILENNISTHFHFEISADLLTNSNFDILKLVPENSFQFEIGIQSASARTLAKVGRTADLEQIFTNVRRLRSETKIELHLDLVAGLPDEDYVGFLASLQRVAEMKPDMLQIEPLKLLKGAPMRLIAEREGYEYSATPPYTILRNPWLSYTEICRIETVGRLLDLFGKHGGCKAAFQILEQYQSYAVTLDKMSKIAGNENLSSLSTRRFFELFARLALFVIDLDGREQLYDAIFFDYCQVEMPMADKLPGFAVSRQKECRWLREKDLIAKLDGVDIKVGSRVKGFCSIFEYDYQNSGTETVKLPITFIYISTAGEKLKILVSPDE